ncbi:MAG: hypothetical protein Q4E33_05430 [Erysipelotrichaceae bacterium]|nr:hypothetical protein [Erysipelotrichaceae bacterium]
MKKFNFVFKEEEVIDYYTYVLSSLPSNRLKQVFIFFSIPLLLILSYVFFKINNFVISIIFIIVGVIWSLVIAPRFWRAYTKINIGKKFLKKNKIQKYENVEVEVGDDYMNVNGKKYDFNNKVKIVKTETVTIFFFPGQSVAIPNRFLNTTK